MARLAIQPLSTKDAREYWRVFISGRSDLPTPDPKHHMELYLSLPPEEQRTHFAICLDDQIIGTVRLLPAAIAGFSMDPSYVDLARPAVLKAVDRLRARGAEAITATFEERYEPVFKDLGFRRHFARIRMEAPVSTGSLPIGLALRPPEEAEIAGLTEFLRDVYEGHIEQQFGMHVGTPEEWRAYVAGLLKGEGGQFLPDASFVALEGARTVGAILITRWMGMPLVAELGVARDRRMEGLGRALLQAAMNRLADRAEPRLSLYTTIGNDPAIHLYTKMGFTQLGGQAVTARLE